MTTAVPSIPPVSGDNVEYFLSNVKMLLDVREGRSGDALDANVTYRDLVNLGLAKDQAGQVVYTGQSGVPSSSPVRPFNVGEDGYDPVADLTPPPAPNNVTISNAIGSVILAWSIPSYRNHSYSEVWRSGIDDVATAEFIGTSSTQFYIDSPEDELVWYYWIRLVSKADVRGPYSQESAKGTSEIDPATLVRVMQGKITESVLAKSLAAKINRLDENVDVIGSVQNALAIEKTVRDTETGQLFAQYTVKIDQNGYVSGFGLASETVDGQTTSSFIVRADNFAVVNPSASPYTILQTFTGQTGNIFTGYRQYVAFRLNSDHGFESGDSVVFRDVAGFNGSYTATSVIGDWLYFYRDSNPPMPGSAPTLTADSQILKGAVPFVVSDGKVYIQSAAIADASITSAKISELSATKITAGYINAAVQINGPTIFAGTFYSGGTVTINENGSFFANNPTARIANGIAEFDATTFRILNGNVYTIPFEVVNDVVYIKSTQIRDASITSAKISVAIASDNYVSGSSGWAIFRQTGTAEFQNVTLRGSLKSSDGNFEIDTINKRIRIIS